MYKNPDQVISHNLQDHIELQSESFLSTMT